jgi:hypothetical protein
MSRLRHLADGVLQDWRSCGAIRPSRAVPWVPEARRHRAPPLLKRAQVLIGDADRWPAPAPEGAFGQGTSRYLGRIDTRPATSSANSEQARTWSWA